MKGDSQGNPYCQIKSMMIMILAKIMQSEHLEIVHLDFLAVKT